MPESLLVNSNGLKTLNLRQDQAKREMTGGATDEGWLLSQQMTERARGWPSNEQLSLESQPMLYNFDIAKDHSFTIYNRPLLNPTYNVPSIPQHEGACCMVHNNKIRPMQKNPSSSNSKILQSNHITALAFSHRHDYCAVATKVDHFVRLFKVGQLNNLDSWQLLQEMRDHSQTVADIDWASDNKIVTSSHDRSVIVWRQVGDSKWEKMLVNIDIKLSILVSKWAPSCKKFALGSSCNTLALGFYNVVAKCWTVATRSSLAKAPITTLCFHPSSNLLVMGSADFAVKVVAASFKKSKDEFIQQSKVEDYPYNGPFAQVDSLFEVLLSIDNLGGWVNHVSFENNGNSLLIVPHTNHIKVLQIGEGGNLVKSEDDIKWNGLPFLNGFIGKNNDLLLGGYDKKVARFAKKGRYEFANYLATNQKTGQAKKTKGLVANFTKNIEKKDSLFGSPPTEEEHVNFIKLTNAGGTPVSYDVSGVVHFWQG